MWQKTQVAAMTRTGGYDHTCTHKHTSCHPNSQTVRQNYPRPWLFHECFAHRSIALSHVTVHFWDQETHGAVLGRRDEQLRTNWRSQGQLWLMRALSLPHMDCNTYLLAGITRELFINAWVCLSLSLALLLQANLSAAVIYSSEHAVYVEVKWKIQICISKYALACNPPPLARTTVFAPYSISSSEHH